MLSETKHLKMFMRFFTNVQNDGKRLIYENII